MSDDNYLDTFRNALVAHDRDGRNVEEWYEERFNYDQAKLLQYFHEIMRKKGDHSYTLSDDDIEELIHDEDYNLASIWQSNLKYLYPFMLDELWYNIDWARVKEKNRKVLKDLDVGHSVDFVQRLSGLFVYPGAHLEYLAALYSSFDSEVGRSPVYKGVITMDKRGSVLGSGYIAVSGTFDFDLLKKALRSEAFDGEPITKKHLVSP
ncbi:MAG: hypothetical protein H0T78_10755 [Longispora sp.]|nr:hypothetical protein [Longispora sp. (in: high G+C Gram-positive bacteria)]